MIVIEYLEKLYHSTLEQKISFDQQLSELELQLQENSRFIHLLEESSDPNFEAFSPRSTNFYQNTKIKELKQEKKEIQICMEEVQSSIKEIQSKLDELEIVLKEAKKIY